jgi:DNA-binding transcriptional regulator YiaG
MAAMKLPKGVTPRKFARALQAWREKKAFSQRDAAEFLGISKRTLENWEQERATPRGYAVVALIRLIDPPAQLPPSTRRKTR